MVAQSNAGVAALRDIVTAMRSDPPRSLAEERAGFDATPQFLPDGTRVDPTEADGVAGEWLIRDDSRTGTVLFMHGGGYRVGSTRSHRGLAAQIGMAAHADCLSIDYRLAPEHPCPAAVEDAVRAYRWLIGRGTSAGEIVLAGDSAGGGLVAATLLALRDSAEEQPAGAVLLAPWLDLTLSGKSIESRRDADFMLDPTALRQAALEYAGSRALDDPYVSPLFGDLRGLPPILVQVGDADVLVDDAIRFDQRAKAAGVDVELEVWADMPHVFQSVGMLIPEANDALRNIGRWIGAVLERDSSSAPRPR